ncbi:hypothetical protein F5X71_34725 [Nocardia brasiliensis]|uniref:Uncharacterized protein n=1 Tax=Nocardia brasiliensis TaxID=37326 RepID=A0A6G9Y0R6_NOCBR|nr:hypothetical protein [Nocardia brasiliensis]QIS06781.1 hypothetical protein F5X71_34725 [Nocardia brasiliensis]
MREKTPYLEWLAAERDYHQLLRDEEAAWRERARREARPKGHVGEVGAKLAEPLCGVVSGKHRYESADRYGRVVYGRILTIALDDGRVVKWATGSDAAYDREVGDRVRILRATVKKHSNFRGQDETELKLVKLELIEQNPS